MQRKTSVSTDNEIQTLRQRVTELEQQLAKAQAVISALTSLEQDKWQAKSRYKHEQSLRETWDTEKAELLANEERLQSALFLAPYPLMIGREDGKVVMINAAWTEITGDTLESIPTIAEWSFSQGQSLIPDRDFFQQGIKNWGEFEITTRSGEKRIWDFSTAPLGVDEKGRRLVMTMAVDVTDRKRAEELFNKAFHASPNALVISRQEDGRIETVNDAFIDFFGYGEQEVLGKTSIELGMFADPTDRQEAVGRLQKEGSVREFELNVRLKSGEIRSVSLSAELMNIDNKNILLTTIQDVTERKQVEEALRESEQRFRSLADSMPQLVWTARSDGSVDYYNQRYHEYWGIQQVEGATWEWAPVLHPDDLQPTIAAWRHSVETGEIYQIEHQVRMADGSYRWHLSRGMPMFDKQGQIIRWFGTATDIHEQKVAQEKLKDYSEQLENSNRELEQFAFMASHDLQEPLRKIEVFGDLLLERSTSLDGRERSYLDRMRGAAEHMRDMVEGLLQLSRVTTQGRPFVRVSLAQVVEEVLYDLETQIRRTGGRVEVGNLPAIDGDPLQLHQLMQNLIGNALKYYQPDVPPEVKVHATQLLGTVQITVEDKGIGFEQEDAQRIFQPFQRLVGRSQYEGSGMGLAICRRIVERHGGDITARSKPGQGAAFIVTLPMYQYATMPASKDVNDEDPGSPPGRGG